MKLCEMLAPVLSFIPLSIIESTMDSSSSGSSEDNISFLWFYLESPSIILVSNSFKLLMKITSSHALSLSSVKSKEADDDDDVTKVDNDTSLISRVKTFVPSYIMTTLPSICKLVEQYSRHNHGNGRPPRALGDGRLVAFQLFVQWLLLLQYRTVDARSIAFWIEDCSNMANITLNFIEECVRVKRGIRKHSSSVKSVIDEATMPSEYHTLFPSDLSLSSSFMMKLSSFVYMRCVVTFLMFILEC